MLTTILSYYSVLAMHRSNNTLKQELVLVIEMHNFQIQLLCSWLILLAAMNCVKGS